MKPCDCKNIDDVCQMETDHVDIGNFFMMTDGHTVSFSEQELGKPPSQTINIDRRTFEKMIAWWNKEQKKP